MKDNVKINLGHAFGKDLGSLIMTEPVLLDTTIDSAKEVSIAPLNSKGFRYNLIESRDIDSQGIYYSVIKVVAAKDMGSPWEYCRTVLHPKDHDIKWIGGHASPGPLFPETFINIGKGKRVGIINGCTANKLIHNKIMYGVFSVGIFIYDYENGRIEWVSPEPIIKDSEAKRITFASQFIDLGSHKGRLYAHVDDSFVRAYDLCGEEIKKLLPEKYR